MKMRQRRRVLRFWRTWRWPLGGLGLIGVMMAVGYWI
jgi:hypothetical protein